MSMSRKEKQNSFKDQRTYRGKILFHSVAQESPPLNQTLMKTKTPFQPSQSLELNVTKETEPQRKIQGSSRDDAVHNTADLLQGLKKPPECGSEILRERKRTKQMLVVGQTKHMQTGMNMAH